jgi:DNA gyrase subunit A
MGRPAGGVTGARFKRDGDEVVSMIVVPNGDNGCCQVLTVCVNGFGKRTPLEDYPVKGRGTRGVINIDANDRNGEVVGMKLVVDGDEVMLITEKGILIRTRVSEIRQTGRNAAGVKIIRIDEGDRLVAMAKIDADAKAEEGGAATEASDGGEGGDSATPPRAVSDDAPPAADSEPDPGPQA